MNMLKLILTLVILTQSSMGAHGSFFQFEDRAALRPIAAAISGHPVGEPVSRDEIGRTFDEAVTYARSPEMKARIDAEVAKLNEAVNSVIDWLGIECCLTYPHFFNEHVAVILKSRYKMPYVDGVILCELYRDLFEPHEIGLIKEHFRLQEGVINISQRRYTALLGDEEIKDLMQKLDVTGPGVYISIYSGAFRSFLGGPTSGARALCVIYHEYLELLFEDAGIEDPLADNYLGHGSVSVVEHELRFAKRLGCLPDMLSGAQFHMDSCLTRYSKGDDEYVDMLRQEMEALFQAAEDGSLFESKASSAGTAVFRVSCDQFLPRDSHLICPGLSPFLDSLDCQEGIQDVIKASANEIAQYEKGNISRGVGKTAGEMVISCQAGALNGQSAKIIELSCVLSHKSFERSDAMLASHIIACLSDELIIGSGERFFARAFNEPDKESVIPKSGTRVILRWYLTQDGAGILPKKPLLKFFGADLARWFLDQVQISFDKAIEIEGTFTRNYAKFANVTSDVFRNEYPMHIQKLQNGKALTRAQAREIERFAEALEKLNHRLGDLKMKGSYPNSCHICNSEMANILESAGVQTERVLDLSVARPRGHPLRAIGYFSCHLYLVVTIAGHKFILDSVASQFEMIGDIDIAVLPAAYLARKKKTLGIGLYKPRFWMYKPNMADLKIRVKRDKNGHILSSKFFNKKGESIVETDQIDDIEAMISMTDAGGVVFTIMKDKLFNLVVNSSWRLIRVVDFTSSDKPRYDDVEHVKVCSNKRGSSSTITVKQMNQEPLSLQISKRGGRSSKSSSAGDTLFNGAEMPTISYIKRPAPESILTRISASA
ncbi:hypothetical protein ACFL0T_06530 [Candidatus Omnitrophota bacterium]